MVPVRNHVALVLPPLPPPRSAPSEKDPHTPRVACGHGTWSDPGAAAETHAPGGFWSPWLGQRGFALPAATIALLLLTTLLIAFAVLSRSEPVIASNHARAAQARAFAEAGLEHAVWALNSGRIPEPLGAPVAPLPYGGATFHPLGPLGGFAIKVAAGTTDNERVLEAHGYAPAPAASVGNRAHRRVSLILQRLRWLDPPAAISVRGDLDVTATAVIDARADASCGPKAGLAVTGNTTGTGTVLGHGDDTDSGGPPDRLTGIAPSALDAHLFTSADLNTLRAIAQCCGTYLRGDHTFSDTHPLPAHGLVFVDTLTGTDIACTSPPGEPCVPTAPVPTVQVSGNAAPPGTTEFAGWLVVNGGLSWSGATAARGLLYAHDTLTYTGAASLRGALASRNLTGLPSRVDGATLVWDCAQAKSGGGTVPAGWSPRPGSYRELAD